MTRIDATTAGRAYAAYGSVYIVSSICCLWAVEGTWPGRWDVIGAGVALVGAGNRLRDTQLALPQGKKRSTTNTRWQEGDAVAPIPTNVALEGVCDADDIHKVTKFAH